MEVVHHGDDVKSREFFRPPWYACIRGSLEFGPSLPPLSGVASLEPFTSDVLKGNPLGDPSERTIATYVPKGRAAEGMPLLVFLPGFSGGGPGVIHSEPFLGESLFRLFDRLVLSGSCKPAYLIAPDCRTCLGGSR